MNTRYRVFRANPKDPSTLIQRGDFNLNTDETNLDEALADYCASYEMLYTPGVEVFALELGDRGRLYKYVVEQPTRLTVRRAS